MSMVSQSFIILARDSFDEIFKVLEKFKDACIQAGIPETPDFNTGDNEGVGYFKVNQKNGFRVNTAKAFLRPRKGFKNLKIETQAHVQRILFDGNKAIGVHYKKNGLDFRVTANKEIILAAGAIGSPSILQHSGLGPARLLKRNGIDVIKDMPLIGQNLTRPLNV